MPTFRPDPSGLMPEERDACAIIGHVNKQGRPSHGNVERTIDALIKMGHRAGEIGGEGDGCGVLTDLPRALWGEALAEHGQSATLSADPGFVVGHLLVPRPLLAADPQLRPRLLAQLEREGGRLLLERPAAVRSEVLSARARGDEPFFWQIALHFSDATNAARRAYRLQLALEEQFAVHVASLSPTVAAYKVHGAPELLPRYYPELKRRDFTSTVTIGHSRFSTNTLPTVLRAQPFSLLGHNGEINTIARLREEARMLGIPLADGGSDSQDVNRTLEGLIHDFGLSLLEAMELIFPPIVSETARMPGELRELYDYFRRYFRASAQGPAAIIARHGESCVFSVDAMGLRPLWFGETEKEYFISSEVGVVPVEELLGDPKPLAPGEKIALRLRPGRQPQLFSHAELRREVLTLFRRRTNLPAHAAALLAPGDAAAPLPGWRRHGELRRENLLSALAWKSSDLRLLRETAKNGDDPIASLGYDGPLAALAQGRQNLADYFKEQVAVVTNPAIDREREAEHFSTRVPLGPAPELRGAVRPGLFLALPLLGGGRGGEPRAEDTALAANFGSVTLEELLARFGGAGKIRYRVLSCTLGRRESVPQALDRLRGEALAAARGGAWLLLLDDARAFTPGHDFLDPCLVVSALHRTLKEARDPAGRSLRRRVSLVVRSGALRNLHDLIFALGMGADALCPWLMWEMADEQPDGTAHLFGVLAKGLEKVISTMGTHEIGGYGKYFASIGLAPELAEIFETPDFCGSARGGLTFARLEADQRARRAVARSHKPEAVPTQFRLYPRIWKMVGAVAKMEESYADLSRLIQQMEAENPLAIRHLIDLAYPGDLAVDPEEVDTTIGGHDLPILFSAMSFGSQGETAYRIYAETARRLNIICMNGEGGEIADMLGRYRHNRGQQIASGRFGVNMAYLNSVDFLEIKVGQGAKPGEGGHLPGFKITAKIAAARHATPGVTLISPSNNHDLYSIEDLAQIVTELRTANPTARISVKVPAVAGIGTIALGIAKAGADIITISGYDGGTGAARQHALKFVGLPADLGVREAHRALVQAGLRHKVEIWADGGAHTGRDVVKLMLLGANRVGFGTLAMVTIGCTVCRGCHLGTCHVGIATQIESVEEARAKGLKRFVPRVFDNGVIYQTTFFRGMAREIRILTAKLGFTRTQELVGRADLLIQARGHERLDLSELLAPVVPGERGGEGGVRIIRKPLNYLTALISGLVGEAFAAGEEQVRFDDDHASSSDRAIGTHLAGAMVRACRDGQWGCENQALIHFRRDSIPGNGLGAFNHPGIAILVEGGAQDGVGKCASGGKIVVLKGENRAGQRVGGGVGKGLAYGAQGGLFIVQGDADSRACIRLSGADVVLGARIRQPLDDAAGDLASRANLKGFACEYMTAGRVVILGDPGPWFCSGLTGGSVYCHLDSAMGFDRPALRRRLAQGARIDIRDLDEADVATVSELLLHYHRELLQTQQFEEADWLEGVLSHCRNNFVKLTAESVPVQGRVPSE